MLGAIVFIILEESVWAHFLEANQAILGLIIAFLIFFLPGGILKIDYQRLLTKIQGGKGA